MQNTFAASDTESVFYNSIIPPSPSNLARSSWQPGAQTNNTIRHDAGIKSNWNYRRYLQAHGPEIIHYNMLESITATGNQPYVHSSSMPTTNTPFCYRSPNDMRFPAYVDGHDSDLKKAYLAKSQRYREKVYS